jgi:hypothetical protein
MKFHMDYTGKYPLVPGQDIKIRAVGMSLSSSRQAIAEVHF